jgi:hypothetical protein
MTEGKNAATGEVKGGIVITSIQHPTQAVKRFAQIPGWRVYVVADLKTPANWHLPEVEHIAVADQQTMNYPLAKHLPWNSYCRKMLGYLRAIEAGATQIYDTDDDNIPLPQFSFPPMAGQHLVLREYKGFVNVYLYFTKKKIWPRGYPLRLINGKSGRLPENRGWAQVGVWQGLANGDPDVDAVYRLTDNSACFFAYREPLVLQASTVCPFNSQNTLFCQELFPLLYIPSTVSFRFCDILRGLVAQPVMWAAGFQLGFTSPTVIQERNPHDYMADFASEITMYLNAEKVVNIVEGAVSSNRTLGSNLTEAYQALARHNIVNTGELPVLEAWLDSLPQK